MNIKSKIGISIICVSAALSTAASAKAFPSDFHYGLDRSESSLDLGSKFDLNQSLSSNEAKALKWLELESKLGANPVDENRTNRAWWGG